MIKFKNIIDELAEKYKVKGEFLDSIRYIEKLNREHVNREVIRKFLTNKHKAKLKDYVKIGVQYAIFRNEENNQITDYFVNCDNFHIDAVFVYNIDDKGRFVEEVVWKYNGVENDLCKNLYLKYYFKKYNAIISDNNITQVSFDKLWDLLVVASLANGYHAAIVKDNSDHDIVHEIKIGNIVKPMADNYVDKLTPAEIEAGVERENIKELNKIYGGNVRTNRFMIYK